MATEKTYCYSAREIRLMRGALGAFAGAFFTLAWQTRKLEKAHSEVVDNHNRNLEYYKSLYDRVQYLFDTFEQKGVELGEYLDEFDFIALKNMEPPTNLESPSE